jgi:hypothetical protein
MFASFGKIHSYRFSGLRQGVSAIKYGNFLLAVGGAGCDIFGSLP